jgi:hypothetical protein
MRNRLWGVVELEILFRIRTQPVSIIKEKEETKDKRKTSAQLDDESDGKLSFAMK